MTRALLPISPVCLLLFMWVVTIFFGTLPFAFPETFRLALYFLARQGMTPDDFTVMGAAWLLVALSVFVVSSVAIAVALPTPGPFDTSIDFNKAAQITFSLNLLFLVVTFLWVFASAAKMGGFRAMIILVQLDALEAREALLDNKLFTGMRVIYASLPATGAMAAAILAAGRKTGLLAPVERRMATLTFTMNLIVLLLLPIVMSQRLLLLQLIMAAYFSVCMVHRKLVGRKYIPIGLGLFMMTWIGRESLTNATIEASGIEVGIQKLFFYFTNDLLNSFMPINEQFDHTLGYFSFKFITYFTQTEGILRDVLAERLEAMGKIRGGGSWSILTMPYVDFGAVGASIYIAALAALSIVVFHKGTENVIWAAIYGQFAGAYVLCTHAMYFSHTNFFAMMVICSLIGKYAGRRSPQVG
ncbi:hypothetical protein [Roseibium sp.]|uniref:hypothetical protein n=1 Tax=Roseibium sp. TaxID=1936156 RepID=UPI003A97504D